MLSAKEAWEMSEKAEKDNFKKEWSKIKRKIRKHSKRGKKTFTTKTLSYKVRKKLKNKGFDITKSKDGYETISWDKPRLQK